MPQAARLPTMASAMAAVNFDPPGPCPAWKQLPRIRVFKSVKRMSESMVLWMCRVGLDIESMRSTPVAWLLCRQQMLVQPSDGEVVVLP